MKTKIVPSGWLLRDGRRLDCGPYMSGSLEARVLLEKLSNRKDPLVSLTKGHKGGIYNGPQFKRNYVDSQDHGVAFLTGGDVLQADLSRLPLLSRRDAHSPKLNYLRLSPGMTLISCSGAIGRMAYVRPDMDGIWSSQDVMKVVPDPEKIDPGYVFAFLSSKFGRPLVAGGTYGAIIQHIEPEHIAKLHVPRFDHAFENKIHGLVQKSAILMSKYSELCNEATAKLFDLLKLDEPTPAKWLADGRNIGWCQSGLRQESFRALNYDPRARELWDAFTRHGGTPLGSLCEPSLFKGKNIFKRIDAEPAYGVMLLGQRNAFHVRPEGRWISRRSIAESGLAVPPLSTLIPSHGTLGEDELYCRALLTTPGMSNYVFSGDFFRCVPLPDRIRAGYLFAFLRSKSAFRILRSISTGGKQQEQHPAMMWRLPVPRLADSDEAYIAGLVEAAAKSYDESVLADQEARTLVEDAIEGGAN